MLQRFLAIFRRSPPEVDIDQNRARFRRVHADLLEARAALERGDISLEAFRD